MTSRIESRDGLQVLWEISTSSRRMHQTIMESAYGDGRTAGSCLYASVLLASSVNRFTAWQARVRGGSWRGPDGAEHGHYWVQASHNGAEYVLDITADQFEQAPVLVLPIGLAQAWMPGDDAEVERHIRDEGLVVLRDKAQG